MRFDDRVIAGALDAWTIVIPVKHLSAAKSRMGEAGAPALESLAMAFFQDTATAALECPQVQRVVVATSDDRVASWARAQGCAVFDDTEHPGINRAAVAAAPGDKPVAVVVSDLPCATADSLGDALQLAHRHPVAFLADAAGTGTTMWTRLRGVAAQPRFGPDSRRAHRDSTAVDLVDEAESSPVGGSAIAFARMRRDVDTPSDLQDALRLGVGGHTAATTAGMLSA